MGLTDKRSLKQHWPIILLALVVVGIFVIAMVTFQVKETEIAVVKTFGRPNTEDGRTKVYDPGLHLKWPYPFADVWRHDGRWHCYELRKGRVEQIQTKDDFQIIVTTYVIWRVGDPGLFLKRVDTSEEAEGMLDDVVRNTRNIVLGRHATAELINTDPEQVRFREIEQEMLAGVEQTAMAEYGIEVKDIGFSHLGFPEAVSMSVFERMRAERSRKSTKHLAEGNLEATRIKADADQEARAILAKAQADAKRTRAEGDQAAAKHYAVFRENPELAAFLRKLDALRLTLSDKTTLVLDTNTPPYDLFLPGATDLPGMDDDDQGEDR